MAGCGGILGGGGCSKPKDDFTKSMPDSDDYKVQGEVSTGDGEGQEDIEKTAGGLYKGPDGEGYFFVIAEFSSKDVAKEKAKNASSDASGSDGAYGYIITGKYGYVASGPSKDKVKKFMKTSPTLGDSCVENNIEFA